MKHLWTPWRAVYMKEKKDKTGCIFCDAAANPGADEQNLVVLRGASSLVILNKYPYTSGHLMIAPFAHVDRLAGLTEATAIEIMQLTRRAEQVLGATYHPDGFNLGMNLGEAAGAGIDQHIHMHMLPRWNGDANFMTAIADTRIIPESLEDTYSKLRDGFARF
jgi:ATP adenylyltransferase